MQSLSLALASLLLAQLLSGCITSAGATREGPSFATGFDVPESDGVLIEWRRCLDTAPCISGEYEGQSYALGFHDSPSLVVGQIGGKPIRLQLDPNSVYRLGDHALDLIFTDERRETVLNLTWNELDQIPIESQLIPNAPSCPGECNEP